MSISTDPIKYKRKISSVAFYTLGCKLNFSESSYISKSLEENDYKIVEFNEFADAYVINTCSVTENADNKFRYFVKQALKYAESINAGVTETRNLVTTPPNILNPVNFVNQVKKLKKFGLKIEILDEAKLKKIGI